jgi:hypothetical protein
MRQLAGRGFAARLAAAVDADNDGRIEQQQCKRTQQKGEKCPLIATLCGPTGQEMPRVLMHAQLCRCADRNYKFPCWYNNCSLLSSLRHSNTVQYCVHNSATTIQLQPTTAP